MQCVHRAWTNIDQGNIDWCTGAASLTLPSLTKLSITMILQEARNMGIREGHLNRSSWSLKGQQ
jgi:hypothetical protein